MTTNKEIEMEVETVINFLEDFAIDDKFDPDPYKHDKVVLSIDIGIKHLGISVCFVTPEYELKEVGWVTLIDIQEFKHGVNLDHRNCPHPHTKCFADWMNHVFEEEKELFEEADVILLERQPPMGLVGIEQLIYFKYRKKCVLISPNSMHKFLGIRHLDYEQRKVKTMEIAEREFMHERAKERYEVYDRKHDIADSICMVLFWLSYKHEEYRLSRIKSDYRIGEESFDDWIEKYKYTCEEE